MIAPDNIANKYKKLRESFLKGILAKKLYIMEQKNLQKCKVGVNYLDNHCDWIESPRFPVRCISDLRTLFKSGEYKNVCYHQNRRQAVQSDPRMRA